LRFHARELLARAISLGRTHKVRLLEMKAVMTIIPLIEFIIRELGDLCIRDNISPEAVALQQSHSGFMTPSMFEENCLSKSLELYINRLKELLDEMGHQDEFVIINEAQQMLNSHLAHCSGDIQ
jgi:hypothetical protein